MNRGNLNIFLTLILLLSGCASLNSVSLTSIPADRKNQVHSEKSKIIFLGFNFDNDFINELVDDLKRQCPRGKITGVLTKDENINYFLYFVWKKQISATGYCLSGNRVSFNHSDFRENMTASPIARAADANEPSQQVSPPEGTL